MPTPEEPLSDDQVLSALSQIEAWAYALPKAKGIVQKYKEAKEGLPKLVTGLEARKTQVEAQLAQLEPAYAQKETELQRGYAAKEVGFKKDFAIEEGRLKEAILNLKNEAVKEQVELAAVKTQKEKTLSDLRSQIATAEQQLRQTKKDFEDFKAEHGLR